MKTPSELSFGKLPKNAIQRAIESPRGIDYDLVNAQQARRILDRLVGFELSPVLWKKIKTGLSAGRVQSVAVRLIVEREREIEAHKAKSTFRITAQFEVDGKSFQAELPRKFETKQEAEDFLKACLDADFSVGNLEKKPAKKVTGTSFYHIHFTAGSFAQAVFLCSPNHVSGPETL